MVLDAEKSLPNKDTPHWWTVESIDEPEYSRTVAGFGLSPVEVVINRLGPYKITLEVAFDDKPKESYSTSLVLRDYLVVSIGDSYASGEGQPDKPAFLKPEEALLCNPTKARAFLEKALPAIEEMIYEGHPFGGVMKLGAEAWEWIDAHTYDVTEIASDLRDLLDPRNLIWWATTGEKPHPVVWHESNAHRSYISGPSRAVCRAERPGRGWITYLGYARSGSTIQDGLLGPRVLYVDDRPSVDGWANDRGQIQEVADAVGGRTIDVLVVSIGGNDVGFSNALLDFMTGDVGYFSFLGGSEGDDEGERERIKANTEWRILEKLPQKLDQLKVAIDRELNPRHVLITEYPTGLFTETGTNGDVVDGEPDGVFCSMFDMDLDKSDGQVVRGLGKLLNGVLQMKAVQFGWTYVSGIEMGFDGHGYSDDDTYFVCMEESCLKQQNFWGTMHPNSKGTAVYAEAIANEIGYKLGQPRSPH